MDETAENQHQIHRVRRGRKPKHEISASDLGGCDHKAAEYAARVWNGQSPDLLIKDRIDRVIAALKGQGLVPDGVEVGGHKL